jgi:DNA-binding GntR family transcriptional regulator
MDVTTGQRLDPVRVPSLRDSVANSLRKAILTGVFEPGARLSEAALARELGVSRGPVREALITLSREGLVRSRRNRSAIVAECSGDSIAEAVEVRRLLETHVVRKLVCQLNDVDLKRLENLVAEIGRALDHDEPQQAVEADLRFHEEMVALAGNARLHQIWTQLAAHIRLSMSLGLEVEFTYQGMVGTHADLVEALRRRDELGVVQLIDRHFEQGSRVITELEVRRATRSVASRPSEPIYGREMS